ncbi:hypothetical protein DHEL01_v212198 [Diaporthe helianthi]|uniref:Uncharacterized protein n=1 Tax=Diaporthe helianthi TaxID=158607 RepID=A0A2P5HGM7_DIAHE|nr:hypothetical protein DHEL01_v212198 [Diaporthe helianthi]
MATPPSLKARGNELKIGCEIETLLSLMDDDPSSSSGNPKPRNIIEAAQLICTKYGEVPPQGSNPALLFPDFVDDLPFEGTILAPTHRNGSWWAKTFRNNIQQFKDKTVADCIEVIEACESIESLAYLMNDGSIRYYAWNFQNLDETHLSTGTIEWRQPAGMDSVHGCIAWIELAIAFVQAGRRPDIDCTSYPETVEGLKDFAWMGVIVDASDARYMDAIFNTRTGAADLVAARQPSHAELMTKIEKDQRKNLMLRKLTERLEAEVKGPAVFTTNL